MLVGNTVKSIVNSKNVKPSRRPTNPVENTGTFPASRRICHHLMDQRRRSNWMSNWSVRNIEGHHLGTVHTRKLWSIPAYPDTDTFHFSVNSTPTNRWSTKCNIWSPISLFCVCGEITDSSRVCWFWWWYSHKDADTDYTATDNSVQRSRDALRKLHWIDCWWCWRKRTYNGPRCWKLLRIQPQLVLEQGGIRGMWLKIELPAWCAHFRKDSDTYIIAEFKTKRNHDLARTKGVLIYLISSHHSHVIYVQHFNKQLSTSQASDNIVNNCEVLLFVGYTSKGISCGHLHLISNGSCIFFLHWYVSCLVFPIRWKIHSHSSRNYHIVQIMLTSISISKHNRIL